MELTPAKLGLYHPIKTYEQRWADGENCFELFAKEALEHAGLTMDLVEPNQVPNTEANILIIPHASTVQPEEVDTILDFVKTGGAIVLFGGSGQIGKKTGLQPIRQLSTGYASVSEDGIREPLRYLKAESLITTPVDDEEISLEWFTSGELRPTPGGPSLQKVWYEAEHGKGVIKICAVDVFSTMVLLQQGDRPVTEDGMPAPDGTAALDDDILKAEDTMQQDWEYDRIPTPSGSMFFNLPYTDLWRDHVVRHIVKTALRLDKTFPVLGYWPSGIKAVAHLSHDSDLNIDESAMTTMDVLKPFNVKSTWCMIEPGYSESVYDRIKEEGHELAFHYNALDTQEGSWDRDEFKRQFHWLTEAIGTDEVTSNKNHYTRFEGWGELFAWCEEVGIQLDQTRGPSKGGNRGFVNATCHVFKPIAWQDAKNRLYDVLQNGFLTQDLDLSEHWGASDIMYPLLDQVERVEGIGHFLFHQVHIHRSEDARNALKKLLAEAIDRGMPWWTSEQINTWERARRAVHMELSDTGLKVASGEKLEEAVIYIPLAEEPKDKTDIIYRWGVPCIQVVTDITAGNSNVKLSANSKKEVH